MIIETKYNIGDEVWFDNGFLPTKGEIGSINITMTDIHLLVRYDVVTPASLYYIPENRLFPTKEELLKSL